MSEKIEIIEEKDRFFIVRNFTRKLNQILPKEYVYKRIKWGLYEVIKNKPKLV